MYTGHSPSIVHMETVAVTHRSREQCNDFELSVHELIVTNIPCRMHRHTVIDPHRPRYYQKVPELILLSFSQLLSMLQSYYVDAD